MPAVKSLTPALSATDQLLASKIEELPPKMMLRPATSVSLPLVTPMVPLRSHDVPPASVMSYAAWRMIVETSRLANAVFTFKSNVPVPLGLSPTSTVPLLIVSAPDVSKMI